MAATPKWTGKVVGGLLGMLTLGPVGAALGVLLGHQFDSQEEEPGLGSRLREADDLAALGERFFRATFRVMGCLAKADGRVSEQEIAAARAVMAQLGLSAQQVRTAIECFGEGKRPDFGLDAELAGLRAACRGRPELLRIFLEIQVRAALAGNDMQGPVRALLGRCASQIGVGGYELAQIEAVLRIQSGRFRRDAPRQDEAAQLREAYAVLGVEPGASPGEVVKAYRRQLSRHHPDKLKANGLPDSMIEHAKQRTQQIIEAYELIRERRGL